MPAEQKLEIISTRTFDYPREKVFGAFEDPKKLAQWWGPKGFTNTFHEFDFRPEGMWRFVMHGPDGKDYLNLSKFIEIQKPAKIVFVHLETIHVFQMTVIFEDAAGKTKLTWQMIFESRLENEPFREFLMQANQQNFDRLEACLASMP